MSSGRGVEQVEVGRRRWNSTGGGREEEVEEWKWGIGIQGKGGAEWG